VLDATATNLLDQPEIGAVLLAYRDVTEEHQAEERLLAASRLASIGTLAAGVGHEINNPLTYVLGNLDRVLELILAPGASADPRATIAQSFELIAEARDGAQRIAEIVADLKLLSGPERDELVAVDVDAAVERALTIVASQLVSRGRVLKTLGGPPPAVAAEARLVQAVINLLLNAAQALPSDGGNGEIEIATTSAADEVVVSVSDTGAGIPESVRRQIFEPHFTTKRTSGGTGLGLWVVRRIIEAFGGRVDVESEPGRGSTFRLILRAAETGAPARSPARIKTPVTTRGHVLVVDDERLVAASLGRALERVHLVSIATSGQEVLDRMDRGERWDAVVSDVIMPGMSGLELRERVEKRVPALGRRFVFISGGGFDRDIRDALDALGLDYLTKPPDLAALRAAVARLISNAPK
jgi:nitrogen-specific signal transduction histidine kinase/CheY-like chemotaxis protein